ncbi:MAG TPA: glycosyltransferase family 2 protein [Bacteroidales bacterium]|nr:glycosyltransferase family 2 protein [Bacteroidales bacterium]
MLAIIIPYYKADFFEFTLASLANQTDKRFKVYIGNDNSPHDCSQIVENYKKSLNIKYQYFEENFGRVSLTRQWIRCFGMIRNEEWIMFLGDDDVLSPYCVEEFYNSLDVVNRKKIDVVRFSSIIIDSHGNQTSRQYLFPEIELSTTSYIKKAQRKSRASLSEHIFRRTAFEKTGFADMPEAWHTDDVLILEASGYGPVYTINNTCVLIRYSPLSVSGNSGNCWRKNLATIKFLRFLLANKMNHFTKNERNYLIWYYFKKLKHFRKLSPVSILEILKFFYLNFANKREFISKPVKLRKGDPFKEVTSYERVLEKETLEKD